MYRPHSFCQADFRPGSVLNLSLDLAPGGAVAPGPGVIVQPNNLVQIPDYNVVVVKYFL